MKSGNASGLQIAFFTYAVLLLAVPITEVLSRLRPGSPEEQALLNRAVPFFMAAAILLGFPNLRRLCREYLSIPVPPDARLELAIVTFAKLLIPFVLVGAIVLWHWTRGGDQALAMHIGTWKGHEAEMAHAFNPANLVRTFVVAGALAPLFEELVFRGLLYRAWERQLGWVPSMILTSILFALYHRVFWSSFLASILFVCLYRRTGSLWAPIVVHSIGNIALWYPLLGRHIVPRDLQAPGDLSSWSLQLALLPLAAIALPAYVWMAQRKRAPEPCPPGTATHGALPQ